MFISSLKNSAKSLIVWLMLILTSSFAIGASKNNVHSYSYVVSIDKNMSSISSADLSMSVVEGYRQIDDNAFTDVNFTNASNVIGKNDKFTEIVKVFTRLLSASWIIVTNHEIGGHGARAREYKLADTRYSIRPLDGSTNFSHKDFNQLHPHKQQSVSIAGIEANYILSEKVKTRMIESGFINPVYAINYALARMDQIIWVSNTDSNNVVSYIKKTNDLYHANLTRQKLQRLSYLDLLDPFLVYSLYAFMSDKDLDIPMFEVAKNFKYLPSARLVLTPYGAEVRLINHFKFDDKYYQIGLGYGSNKRFKYYSFIANTNNVLKLYNTDIGFDIAAWLSPKMLGDNPINANMQKGGMLMVNTVSGLLKNTSLLVSAGYKTSGFVEGMPLDSSAMVRVGVQFDF